MVKKENLSPSIAFFASDAKKELKLLGKEKLLLNLKRMLLIRQFELRAEGAYLQGKIGGFFHSYMGQEPIQTAAVEAFGVKNWWIGTYRCHALALLLGATPKEIMAELFGKASGNAKGRGGSMHLYTERLLGGFAIVGGHVPVATGAAFALKYKKIKDELALCFLGDGAIAQGAFHESLNLASLWSLPCVYIIENNQWSMGTHVTRGLCMERLAADIAPTYRMDSYTLDGRDFFNCYRAFTEVKEKVLKTDRPILVEVITERFRGHSISDPGLYRSKEELQSITEKDPILFYKMQLIDAKVLTEEEYKSFETEIKDQVVDAIHYAEKESWPDPTTLEEEVYCPCPD